MANSGGKWNVFLQIFFFYHGWTRKTNKTSKTTGEEPNQTKPNQTRPNLQGNATKKIKKEKEKIETKTKDGNEVTKRSRDSKPVQRHRVFNSIESHRRRGGGSPTENP